MDNRYKSDKWTVGERAATGLNKPARDYVPLHTGSRSENFLGFMLTRTKILGNILEVKGKCHDKETL